MAEKQIILPLTRRYRQDWHSYNLAKTQEKRLFYILLYELANLIPQEKYRFGRKPISVKDLFFSAGLKIYSNYSGRKTISDLEHAKGAKFIRNAPHFNTLNAFFQCPATYDLLQRLLTISALPLKELEDDFSIDSSGFGSYQYERWQQAKYKTKRGYRNYLKGHICIGTRTNIITSAEITHGNASDVRQAPQLIETTGNNFNMKTFSGDKAYLSKRILELVERFNALPFIPFRNWGGELPKLNRRAPLIWRKMFTYFKENREEFLHHYHKRSNVETTFAMIKVRLGEFLKAKKFESQRNELLMKFIVHNITCLIQEIFERNVFVDFKKCVNIYVERKV